MGTTIKTSSGILSGLTLEGGISVYKGIPYAKPPVGERRFCRPEAIDTPEEERDCTRFSLSPVQSMFGNRPKFEISEDCLYLNVWTPINNKTEEKKLPVMVWFYGGGFNHGHADDPEFDGRRLAERGVILVTVNYRVGVLGFLASHSLAAKDPEGLAGNYGIYDQICALEWVRDNIAAFGGDPSNVTIFGQSAGGISCRIHLVSPPSRGLFAHAIVESGGGLNEADPIRTLDEFADVADRAMEEAGLSVEDLKTMEAFELEKVMQEATKKVCPNELFFYQPIIDGRILTRTPGELIKAGNYADADVICGTVSGDAWMFCRKVKDTVGNDPQRLRGFAMSPFLSWAVNGQRNGQKPIYTYFFERHIPDYLPGVPVPPGPKRDPSNKTPHTAEIAYVFGTFADQPKQWTEYDRILSDAVMTYWTNFAKTGNPNGSDLENWTEYTEEKPYTMNFRNDGWSREQFPENDMQRQVVEYTIAHPGMLEIWEEQ